MSAESTDGSAERLRISDWRQFGPDHIRSRRSELLSLLLNHTAFNDSEKKQLVTASACGDDDAVLAVADIIGVNGDDLAWSWVTLAAAMGNNLRQHFGKQVKSAHLTEAIAAALGRRTHAALLTDLPLPSAHPKAVLFDEGAFVARLDALGYADLRLPESLWEAAAMNDLPEAAIKEFDDGDKRGSDRWYYECQRRNIPWVRTMRKRKYATVEWDHWSFEKELDEKIHSRFSEACIAVDAIFKKHRVQRSKSSHHPMVGSFEHIPVLAARQAAGEMFLLMYSMITAPGPLHG